MIIARRPDTPVGVSLLAMVVNDNADCLDARSALKSIASRLAPTGISVALRLPRSLCC